MKGPTYLVKPNRADDKEDISHQRNAAWCVAFIRYIEPTSSYTNNFKLTDTKRVLVVENDCVSISISNSKDSFGKMCNIQMRAGEIFYPGAVAPGDWVFAWMGNYQEDIDDILRILYQMEAGNYSNAGDLSKWNSGFKFFGRVLRCGVKDTVSDSGQRTVIERITAQSFLELSSSVYYTETAQAFFLRSVQAESGVQLSVDSFVKNGLDVALNGLGNKFVQFFKTPGNDPRFLPTPDAAVAFYYVISQGVDTDTMNQKLLDIGNLNMTGALSDAIVVPPAVAAIFGKQKATKLWELNNVYLGIQKYGTSGNSPWERMSPQADIYYRDDAQTLPVFFRTPYRLKGWVNFYPTPWDNKSLWSILNEYLNAPMNELYTVLRADRFGHIRPTIMVREKPFGTHLFDVLQNKKIVEIKETTKEVGNKPKLSDAEANAAADRAKQFKSDNESLLKRPDRKVRAMYDSHPRWVISEAMIRDVDVDTSESNRVNFVQLWGRNSISQLTAPQAPGQQVNSFELARETQLIQGNMVSDDSDIKRNGLRADVQETPFDFPSPYVTETSEWSRIRADWMFNGHMRAEGTITLYGVKEPICEGDNVQVRGIVYHIDGVDHSGSISGGRKTFFTTLRVSRGITAYSLDNDQLPSYLYHQGADADVQPYVPGTTDVQRTFHSNRDPDGERGDRKVGKPKEDG